MTNSNTQDKRLSQNKTQPQNTNHNTDSITEVHLLDAPRKSVSFKCNEKLWKSFVSQIRAQGLSVCHILEPMIYGWLEGKVHLSNTIKPLHIENITVERAVRRVRRYAVEEEEEGEGCCWVSGDGRVCGAPVEFEVKYVLRALVPNLGFKDVYIDERDTSRVRVCKVHYDELRNNNLFMILSWKPVSRRES